MTSQADEFTSQAHAFMHCMHCPMTLQTDACSYYMGSVALISSRIYLYLQLLCRVQQFNSFQGISYTGKPQVVSSYSFKSVILTDDSTHLTGSCIHALHVLPHDISERCMQLLHGLCCINFILDIPLSPATL